MSIRALFRRFLSARSGVAAVEFALILPVMLVLYVGGVEVSQGIAADRKLEALANTVGDLVARHSRDVSRTTIRDYFTAATPIMLPFDADGVSQRITIVRISASGVARVTGSVADNGAAETPADTIVTLPPSLASLAEDNIVIIAEAWYRYIPVLGYVVDGGIDLEAKHYFVLRDLGYRNDRDERVLDLI